MLNKDIDVILKKLKEYIKIKNTNFTHPKLLEMKKNI